MSTLAAADLSSDDEHDADFQLPDKPKESRRKRRRSGSDSEGSSSGSGDDTGGVDDLETKQLREEQVAAETAERKKKAEAAFAAMKDQSGSGSSTIAADAGVKERLVEVRRARRFAGDTIYETVMLPADHPEAVEQIRRTQSEESAVNSPATSSTAFESKSQTTVKKPVRRKPRQSLEAMSAALDKGKKMTTLEKSQMDWKSHTSGDRSINDELEANRRAGGFLQKKDFLDRVGERRSDTFEERRKAQR